MSKDVTIRIGAYSANIEEFKSIKGGWLWCVCHFLLSDSYGLDIDSKEYKHKSSAVRYARQQLQTRHDAHMRSIRL